MKREFRHENFEEFIKRNADNLRMKAPEKVWQKLSSDLDKGRRRFGIMLSAFFLVTAVLGYLTISTTTGNLQVTPSLTDQLNNQTAKTSQTAGPVSRRPADINLSTVKPRNNRLQKFSELSGLNGGFVPSTDKGQHPTASQTALTEQPEFTPTVVDAYPGTDTPKEAPQSTASNPTTISSDDALPWTIESATNLFTGRKKNSRFQTQFHFTPTISYRKLSENKSYLRTTTQFLSQPNYAALYGSVNSMVTHKPDIGFELGVTEKYSLSQKVRLRAGLQFNVNRYDIKAFQAPYAVATIALSNPRTARIDSVWALTNYSNVDASSNKGSWLQNFSFQVSAPVGVELALKGNEKMHFGIATSIQPTYILGDRTYLITNNYKSYTQVPWLLRRWNVNTAFETFVSYQSGKTRWQVGPQVRYQLLSSFISNYPVKENLFDFGLKIGLSVNQ